MSLLGAVANVVSGGTTGLVDKAVDLVKGYFPSEADKLKFQLEMDRAKWEHEKQVNDALNESEKAINERIAAYEGTAKDLAGIPILGPLMLFLRGSQRPVWGFACMYIDYMVFSKQWDLSDQQVSAAFYVLNLLILGFLFGERAVMNVMPAITEMMKAKKAT